MIALIGVVCVLLSNKRKETIIDLIFIECDVQIMINERKYTPTSSPEIAIRFNLV